MRLVLAEDHALLRDGLIRILEAHDHEIVAAVDHADALSDALADPYAEGAVLDVRLPPTHTDEGLRAAVDVRDARPGFPVMVLSQYVERIYARELLASGEGGDRLPAQGPGRRRRRVRRLARPGRRGGHRPGPARSSRR